jgi:excinuclease ABC subunit C
VPSSPGVYAFADKHHHPLYIGKSINLRSRARQHLDSAKIQSSKAKSYLEKSHYYQYRQTKNDLEAIILESYLIKITTPHYNSISKDDKSYSYITFSNPPFSKIEITHSTDLQTNHFDNPKTQIFGPYLSVKNAKNLLKISRQIFGYCQKPYNPNQKSCFYYHLHQCPGACTGEISPKNYTLHLRKIKRFLSGKFQTLEENLTKKIKIEAQKENFETAQKLKLQLERLKIALTTTSLTGFLELPAANLQTLNKIYSTLGIDNLNHLPKRIECYDIAHLQQKQTVGSMIVLQNGQPTPSLYRHFIIKNPHSGDPHSLKEIIIRRLNHPDWPQPDLILLDGGLPQLGTVSKSVKNISLIALSKKHETLHYYHHGKVINLNLTPHHPILKMLQTARDEAHRFATTFHQKKRRLAILKSA